MNKTTIRRGAALLFFLLLLTGVAQSALAVTIYGSLPDDGVYVEQPKKHTCTVTAATMMLRNYAYQSGYDYSSLTVAAVAKYCWGDYGLAKEFEIGSVSVRSDTGLSNTDDPKAYLIAALKAHPEGVVIYNANQPHAVFLFGYRADADTFFCADTTGKRKLKMSTLSETLLSGESQQDKLNGLTKLWYIAG